MGLRNLRILSISSFELRVPPSLKSICGTLTRLILRRCDISKIPNSYFDNCKVLEDVTISRSKITGLPRMNAIHGQLKFLNLEANEIVDIRHLYSGIFPKLRRLELQRNRIISIEAHLLVLPVVENVTLTRNRLVEMPDLTQSTWGNELPENKYVNVRIGDGNPWHCSARMLWVIDFNFLVNTTDQQHRFKVVDLERMVCQTPADMTGKIISDVGKFYCYLTTVRGLF